MNDSAWLFLLWECVERKPGRKFVSPTAGVKGKSLHGGIYITNGDNEQIVQGKRDANSF
jgi:hypothetical protein